MNYKTSWGTDDLISGIFGERCFSLSVFGSVQRVKKSWVNGKQSEVQVFKGLKTNKILLSHCNWPLSLLLVQSAGTFWPPLSLSVVSQMPQSDYTIFFSSEMVTVSEDVIKELHVFVEIWLRQTTCWTLISHSTLAFTTCSMYGGDQWGVSSFVWNKNSML